VQAVCKNIKVTLAFRGNINEKILKGSNLWLYIDIKYEGSARADGSFDIEIGDAEFLFSSASS